jgi:hypothetical protein
MPDHLREKLATWKRERAEKPDRAWMALPDERRAQLVCLLTERNPASAHMVRWSDLTEVERLIIQVEMRGIMRDLAEVAPVLAGKCPAPFIGARRAVVDDFGALVQVLEPV